MKKIFFLLLAFFATNSIFSQRNSKVDEILGKMPEIDQIMIDRFYREKYHCPKPPAQKPVGHRTHSEQAPTPSAPIVNIIGDNQYEKIEITNDRNGFRLNLEKAKPICCPCPDKIWVPIVKGDSVILFPGADPVPLPHVLPNPKNGSYFNSVPDLGNPSGASSGNYSGMSEKFGYPLFLAVLLGLLMLWGAYLLSRFRSTGTSSITSITSETTPDSKPAPVVASGPLKTEAPVSENKKEETEESKSRNRQHYRDLGNERKSGGGEEEAG